MGTTNFDVVQANQFIGGMSLPQLKKATGQWYFVDENHVNASDGNKGTDPQYPFNTFTYALATIVGRDKGDGLCVMDGAYTGTTTHTLSIDDCIITGPPSANKYTTPVSITCTGSVPTITVTGDNNVITKLEIVAKDGEEGIYISGKQNDVVDNKIPGPGEVGVLVKAGTGSNVIHNNVIIDQDEAGIKVLSSPNNVIDGNTAYHTSSHVMICGVKVNGNLATGNIVSNNIIHGGITGKMLAGIAISGSATHSIVVNNLSQMVPSAAGRNYVNLGGTTNMFANNKLVEIHNLASASANNARPFTSPFLA